MATKFEQVEKKAIDILTGIRDGIRDSELRNRIGREIPGMSLKTISGYLWKIGKNHNRIYKPLRGIYKIRENVGEQVIEINHVDILKKIEKLEALNIMKSEGNLTDREFSILKEELLSV